MKYHGLKLLSLISLLGLLSISGYASGWQRAVKCADSKAQKKCYRSAIKEYKRVLTRRSLPTDSAYGVRARLADCYMKRRRSLKAEPNYAEAVKSPRVDAQTIFNYARCLQSNGKYADAKKWFDKIADDKSVKDKMPKAFSDKCDKAIKYTYDNKYAISRQQLNTGASESAPAYYKKGIAFTSNASKCGKPTHKKREHYAETYLQYEDKGDFVSAAQNSMLLCSKLKGIAVTFNSGSDEAFITRKFKHKLQIYSSALRHGHWTCPKRLNFEMTWANYGYASLSPDGNTLFFSTDIGGSGFGGMDIYLSKRNGSSWEAPVNLGPVINTSGNETYPFAAADSSLYFASDGQPGYGGFDLFHAKYKAGKFSKADNMGVDFNSPKDDISLIVNSKTRTGFFASDREGDKDIYSFRLIPKKDDAKEKPKETIGTGKIVDKATGLPVAGARIEISRPNNTTEGTFYYSNDSGLFHLARKIESADQVKVTKDKYKVNSFLGSSIADMKSFEVSMDSEMIVSTTRLDFTTIYYEVNKSNLTARTMDLLRPIIDIMKSSPDNVVYVSGYADEQGGDTYNYGLSLSRVREVVDYLSSQGVDMLKIRSAFHGAVKLSARCQKDPKCANDTDRENRRVEIYVTTQK